MYLSMKKEIIPALGFSIFTPFYDFIVKHTTRENLFKTKLVHHLKLDNENIVLDIGCGTGTLLNMAYEKNPICHYYGIDADPQMLARALKKCPSDISFIKGDATNLVFDSDFFDYVISSLFFHHLDRESKLWALAEVNRVLIHGGTVIIADWGKPTSFLMRLLFVMIQLLDGFKNTRDHVTGEFINLIIESGFSEVNEIENINTVFGTLSIYKATKI